MRNSAFPNTFMFPKIQGKTRGTVIGFIAGACLIGSASCGGGGGGHKFVQGSTVTESISPVHGPLSGGTPVTIHGAYLSGRDPKYKLSVYIAMYTPDRKTQYLLPILNPVLVNDTITGITSPAPISGLVPDPYSPSDVHVFFEDDSCNCNTPDVTSEDHSLGYQAVFTYDD